MFRTLKRLFVLTLALMPVSSGSRLAVEKITPHDIHIRAIPLIEPKIELAPELKFIRGWALTSKDENFGGLSALLTDGMHFTSVSDSGLIVRWTMSASGSISGARVDPLPKGCAADNFKTNRDSESITRDPVSGDYWIGLEWRNAICRTDAILLNAKVVANPLQMRRWERTTGPESMVRLADGRFLVIEERPTDGKFSGPALLFTGDPTLPGAKAQKLVYNLPADYFRPTDAAELPDGRLLIMHRNFKPPFRFRGKLAILDPVPARPVKPLKGRIIASFDEKGLTDNFEGVAISQTAGHTYVWIVSDDNYLWLQQTYLLQFELLTPTSRRYTKSP